MSPRVTVLMPVYNAAPYVDAAARSILSSDFRDLELLAINDGSTDDSENTLRAIGDPRLRIVNNPVNKGLIYTLNFGLESARGVLVARMDADDISTSERLTRQIAFMDANPEVGLSGTWATTFGYGPKRTLRQPLTFGEIHVRLFGYNAFGHSTVILRRDRFLRHELRFCEQARHAEDLDLWMRAAECFPLANIPLVGLRYRVHQSQVSHRYAAEQHDTLCMLRKRQLVLLVPEASEAQTALHLKILDVGQQLTLQELEAAGQWLVQLEHINDRVKRYDAKAFRAFLAGRWLNVAHRCVPATANVWRTWRRSHLSAVGVAKRLRLFSRTGLRR